MGEKTVELKIIKVTSPWSFLAVQIHDNSQRNKNEFKKMQEEMQIYFEVNGQAISAKQPNQGDVCAALKRETEAWQRVRVEEIVKTSGLQARCFSIDDGETFTTSFQRLRWLPPKFREFPSQVRQCSLWGVQPLSLELTEASTGLVAKKIPCQKWDVSSVTLMRSIVRESSRCQAEIKDEDAEGILYLCLYLHTTSAQICLNEKLIEEEYATSIEPTYLSGIGYDSGTVFCSSAPSKGSDDEQMSLVPPFTTDKTVDSAGDMPPLIADSDSLTSLAPNEEAFFHAAQVGVHMVAPIGEDFVDLESCVQGSNFQEGMMSHLSSNVNRISPSNSDPNRQATSPGKFHQHLSPTAPEVPRGRGSSLLASLASKPVGKGRGSALLQLAQKLKKDQVSSSSDSEQTSSLRLNSKGNISAPVQLNLVNLNTDSKSYEGEGARPKTLSKLKVTSPIKVNPLTTALGLDSKAKSLKSGNESSGSETKRTKVPVSKTTNGESPTKRVKARSGESSDDGAKSSSQEQPKGHRNRYRRSLDPTLEATEDSNKKKAEAREGKDLYATQMEMDIEMQKNKLKGDSLLKHLRNTSQQQVKETAQPMVDAPGRAVANPFIGVAVYGKNIPAMRIDVIECPFHEDIIDRLLDRKHRVAQGIQGYSWPAISSLRHVVGVSTLRQGRTMAYVPALVSLLGEQINYISLPKGKGPQALIVVPSWKKAVEVRELVDEFTGEISDAPEFSDVRGRSEAKRHLRTIVLYAGGTEGKEKTKTDLIKGCEILIATPNSLLRTLDSEVTSLKRVCHIILDDSEVLARHFSKEINDLMQQYKIVLKDRRHISVPGQICVFAGQWSKGLEEFRARYTKEPVLMFSSRVEAAVYGGVKQIVRMSKSDRKLSAFSELLDSYVQAGTGDKLIAWTEDAAEATEMYKVCQSRSIYSLVMHHKEECSDALEEARARWLEAARSKELVVMVCTDRSYHDLMVTNATCVVHYGLPPSKTKFGNRLITMKDNFYDVMEPQDGPPNEPVSHIIITEKDAENVRSLLGVLERCDSVLPDIFYKFMHGVENTQESDERKPLCPLLKAFGSCMHKNTDHCDYRHILLPSQDLKTGEVSVSTLPHEGEVKVKVVNVINATQYWCQLIEHVTPVDRKRTDLRVHYSALVIKMAAYFANEKNHVPYVPSGDCFTDKLCGFKDKDEIVYRAKVKATKEGTMLQCRLWLVDRGLWRVGQVDQLVELPPELAGIPYQAIEVFACRIKPMDRDSQWTDKADLFAHELVDGKILTGRIVLRLGLNMWLEPLVHQVMLKNIGRYNDLVIRQELLANNLAIPNHDHIPNLYKLCRGKTEIPETIMQKYFEYCEEVELLQETLTHGNDFHRVLIASVDSPDLFYVQKVDTRDRLEELEETIEKRMSVEIAERESPKKSDMDVKIKQGSVCLAKSDDDQWYRGKVMSVGPDGSLEVFCLDYGNVETVSPDMARPLPREFSQLPCQAIECKLAHIKPKGSEWSPVTVDIMCDQAYDPDNDKKDLFAQVVYREDPDRSVGQKLAIDLVDARHKSFGQELVWRQEACIDGGEMEVLIGKPALKNQLFFNTIDKIAFLSAVLYWEENEVEAQQNYEELYSIFSIRTSEWDTILEQRHVLHAALTVIGYLSNGHAHASLLDGLTQCCIDSLRICELCITDNLVGRLVYCLEQTSRPNIQIQGVKSIVKLLSLERFVSACGRSQLPSLLSILLCRSKVQLYTSEELISLVCKAASMLVKETGNMAGDSHDEEERAWSCDDLKSSEMLDMVCWSLRTCKHEEEKSPWLELMCALAQCTSLHPCFMRENCLTLLVDTLRSLTSQKTLSYMLSGLHCLVAENRKNKVVLLEHELLIVLNNLHEQGLTSPALELCCQLQAAITLQLPQQEVLAGVPAQKNDTVRKVSAPRVKWMENCFRVCLTVMINGAALEDFRLERNRLIISSFSEGVLYELDWELRGNIVVGKSSVKPYQSQTQVFLRKEQEGKWGHLLKHKIKPSTLSLDYEKVYDSDEDEGLDEDGVVMSKAKGTFAGVPRTKYTGPRYHDSSSSSEEIKIFTDSDDDEVNIDTTLFNNFLAHKD